MISIYLNERSFQVDAIRIYRQAQRTWHHLPHYAGKELLEDPNDFRKNYFLLNAAMVGNGNV